MVLSQQSQVEDRHPKAAFTSVKKIGLMGPFGGNLGDAAIQQAMIQNIKNRYINAEIYGFSLDPKDTERRHDISSFAITRLGEREQWWLGKNPSRLTITLANLAKKFQAISNPIIRKLSYGSISLLLEIIAVKRSYKTIKTLDLFIVSGGGQLDDYWWGARFHPYSLFLWATLAKLSKTNFAIVSVGAGPISAKLSQWFIKYALSAACYRSYRDKDSKEYVARVVGFQEEDPVYPDLAHSLDTTVYPTEQTQTKYKGTIGIGPIPYFDPRIWPEKDDSVYAAYINKLVSFISWLIEQNYQIWLFAGEPHSDCYPIQDLKEAIATRNPQAEEQILTNPVETVDELMSQLALTDFIISSRFHGILLAQLIAKPVLALSYHPKIDKLMAEASQSEYCLAIEDFEVDSLIQRFKVMVANGSLLQEQLQQRTQKYKAALRKQYERLFQYL
jgi:polysaccharide pyruvyl transferase WcaK-like protein